MLVRVRVICDRCINVGVLRFFGVLGFFNGLIKVGSLWFWMCEILYGSYGGVVLVELGNCVGEFSVFVVFGVSCVGFR